jgi:2-phosphosulfolactate phosphatase
MQFSRIFLNRLQEEADALDTVVVIDVLRSFTTAAVALARGARVIYPVDGLSAATCLAERLRGAVSVGAVAGGAPAPGFAFGNSPAQLLQADLAGRAVVLCTAAGVLGLRHFRHARRLYAASLVCAGATARAIQASGARRVCFVITGEWVDRDGDEDIACADYLEALLRGTPVSPEIFARRVRHSDFGRRFATGHHAHLPAADLELAAAVDLFDFALPVHRRHGRLLIRPAPQSDARPA